MRSEGGGVAGLIRASPTMQSRQTDAVSGCGGGGEHERRHPAAGEDGARGVIPVEVSSAPWRYTTLLEMLDHWQSLAAGLIALLAAIVAVGGPEFFARLKERREIKALRAALAGGKQVGPHPPTASGRRRRFLRSYRTA